MCAIFGFLDYKGILSNTMHKKLINALAVNAEIRGTDATGISYINDGKLVTFKKAKPAHKVKLYFPAGTKAVIGHTRFTTQGSEKHNYNNHPFEGKTDGCSFALAHNGVLHNDKKLKLQYHFPETKIETDSYVAVQLLEHQNVVDFTDMFCSFGIFHASADFIVSVIGIQGTHAFIPFDFLNPVCSVSVSDS